MSKRLSDFFALEAGEYLVQLDAVLEASPEPDLAEVVRLTRGVRGSAQVAGVDTLARVAERLEAAGGAALAGALAWDAARHEAASLTVRDLRRLVRSLDEWGPEQEQRVRAALQRWDGLGLPAAEAGPRAAEEPVPIARLFHDDAGPHLLFAPARPAATLLDGLDEEEDAVPVESLLLRGGEALQAALRLRPRLDEALGRADGADPGVAPLLDELFDLVRLGLDAGP